MPKVNIVSAIKLKALKLVEDCSKHRMPASELESALDLTANQRQRVLYSLRRDGLIDYSIVDGDYFFKNCRSPQRPICEHALVCEYFSSGCEQGCFLPDLLQGMDKEESR